MLGYFIDQKIKVLRSGKLFLASVMLEEECSLKNIKTKIFKSGSPHGKTRLVITTEKDGKAFAESGWVKNSDLSTYNFVSFVFDGVQTGLADRYHIYLEGVNYAATDPDYIGSVWSKGENGPMISVFGETIK